MSQGAALFSLGLAGESHTYRCSRYQENIKGRILPGAQNGKCRCQMHVLENNTGSKYLNCYCRSRFIVHQMMGRLQTIRDGLEMPKNTRSQVFHWVMALIWSQVYFF